MAQTLDPFFRCECEKMHTRYYVTMISVCTCGRKLEPIAWEHWIKSGHARPRAGV